MLDTDTGASRAGEYVSPYLLNEPRILRDACHAMRRDNSGRRCPLCSVQDFCEAQARRAGRFEAFAD